MTKKYIFNESSAYHPEHLKKTWSEQNAPVSAYTAASVYTEVGGDPEYVSLFGKHYADFSGKILEIGAGTGWFAKQILSDYDNIDYTILDIEKNIPSVKKTLVDFQDVKYVTSGEYRKIFSEEWDLLIETHTLSETPRYYYTDILNNLSVKSCFVIDYGGDPNDPDFDKSIKDWFEKFTSRETFRNHNLLGGKSKGIPVYRD